jgi:hypothetical protein
VFRTSLLLVICWLLVAVKPCGPLVGWNIGDGRTMWVLEREC